MNNKIFSNIHSASYYFKSVSYNYVAYLIHERDSNTYIVCNQDLYEEYSQDEDMNVALIRMSY